MEDSKVQSGFKLLGTLLGAVIIIAALAFMAYSLMNPSAYSLALFGLIGVVIGAFIVYAARRHG